MEFQLTAERVNQVFLDVQVEIGGRPVQGIYGSAQLDETKLEAYEREIDALLAELPDGFHTPTGAAFPFMVQHKKGYAWATTFVEPERLLLMALALNKCWVSHNRREILGVPDNTPFVGIF